MVESELIGYARKSKAGGAIRLSLIKEQLDNAETYESKDGTVFVPLLINVDNVQKLIAGDKEVTSVSQIVGNGTGDE
jgi:hypothetical protein